MKKKCLSILCLLCASTWAPAQAPAPGAPNPVPGVPNPAPARVTVELSAMECMFAPGKNADFGVLQGYEDILQLPPGSVRVLDHVTGGGNVTARFFARHVTDSAGAKPKVDADSFAPGESGTIAEIEPAGALQDVCDVNIAYRFRTRPNADDPMQEITFTTTFTAVAEHPLLLNLAAVPGHAGTFIAIVATVHVKDADGKPAGNDASSKQQ